MRLSLLKLRINLCLGTLIVGLTASAQTPNAQPEMTSSKMLLRAELVLSPQFCSAKTGHYLDGSALSIGKTVCPQLEAKLQDVFSDLKRIDKPPAAGTTSAQVVLIPKFVDISATQPLFASSQRELVIFLEWTVRDAAGKTVWLQTVEGSSQHKLGWVITSKSRTALVKGAATELANASASKMSAAPELRKLAQ
jgi:hypothetical protein